MPKSKAKVKEEIGQKTGHPSNSPFVDASEASVILGLSLNTIYSYVRQGKIPARRLGRTIRISRDWLMGGADTTAEKRGEQYVQEYDQMFGASVND